MIILKDEFEVYDDSLNHKYRVWYSPYNYPDEEDFMEVTANDEEAAREFVRTNGYVTDVQEIDHKIDPYDECLEEANVVGMGGGWPNLYLPKDAKQYLLGSGFKKVNTEMGPCFYMRFTGNEVWEIYVTEEDGAIYVVQEGYDIRQTDSLTLIDDRDYRDDINALINLGNCLSNGEDFDSCIDAFFRGDLHTESISRRNKNVLKKSRLREFYHYNHDNQKIIDLLCKIEDTGDNRKIDRAYDFVNRSCDNIDSCTEAGWYDLSDASWCYGTDYIIEELTDILNESIHTKRKSRINERVDTLDDAILLDSTFYYGDGTVAYKVQSDLFDDMEWENKFRDLLPDDCSVSSSGYSDILAVFADSKETVQSAVDEFNKMYIYR